MEEGWDAVDETPASPAPKAKRKLPRPGGPRADPNIDWPLAEKLYVEGELVGEAELCKRVYPRHNEIARRAKTTPTNLAQHITRYQWREKRCAFMASRGIVPKAKEKPVEHTERPLSGRAPARDPEATLVAYIDLIGEAVEKRTLKHETIADLDKAVRLLAYVRGQAESTKHTHVTVSLDVMQRRHAQFRHYVATKIDDDVAGVLGQGDPVPAAGDELSPDEDESEAWDAPAEEGAHAAE